MPLKLLLIISVLILSSCGNADGKRRRGLPSVGVSGLSNDDLASFRRLVDTFEVDKLTILPKNGDQIKYLVGYANNQEISFKLDSGPYKDEQCNYLFKEATIHEVLTVTEEGKLTNSQTSWNPVEPTYKGYPNPLKSACEEAKASAFPKVVNTSVDLASRLVDYKFYLKTHMTGLINTCQSRKFLKDGRCLELKVDELKRERSRFFTGSAFRFETLIRTSKSSKNFKSAFSLDFAHFYFGGLIYQDGLSGMSLKDHPEILALQIQCLNSECD